MAKLTVYIDEETRKKIEIAARNANVSVSGGRLQDPSLRAAGGRWISDHPNLGPTRPRSPSFSGRVIVLINGMSFSATGEFTSLLSQHRRATFVGEEGGAGFCGNTSGVVATVTLEHSGLRVDIPLVRYELAVDRPAREDRGLLPDHPVVPTIEDVLAGRDPALDKALQLAGG